MAVERDAVSAAHRLFLYIAAITHRLQSELISLQLHGAEEKRLEEDSFAHRLHDAYLLTEHLFFDMDDGAIEIDFLFQRAEEPFRSFLLLMIYVWPW